MKRVKLKNNKKKKFNFKLLKFLFFIILIIVSMVITIKYLINNSSDITSDEYLSYLLNESYNKNTNNFILKESLKLLSKIDLTNPSTLVSNKIKTNVVSKNNVIKEKDATMGEDDYSTDIYEKVTTYIENTEKEHSNPIVYLYNSHQLETYSSEGLDNNISPNVLMVSYLLSEKLNKNNIPTIVEDTNIAQFIKVSNLSSDSFYTSTRIFLKNVMSKYTSLKYFIDLHRDSISKDISTCSIDGKNYARILFVITVSNPTYKQNESLMEALDNIADKYYPGLSRGIYKRQTPNWPLYYNQDLNGNVILIEVGAKDNTLDEVSNTIDALSVIIEKHIKGE